jgi:hypothetical protein
VELFAAVECGADLRWRRSGRDRFALDRTIRGDDDVVYLLGAPRRDDHMCMTTVIDQDLNVIAGRSARQQLEDGAELHVRRRTCRADPWFDCTTSQKCAQADQQGDRPE